MQLQPPATNSSLRALLAKTMWTKTQFRDKFLKHKRSKKSHFAKAITSGPLYKQKNAALRVQIRIKSHFKEKRTQGKIKNAHFGAPSKAANILIRGKSQKEQKEQSSVV